MKQVLLRKGRIEVEAVPAPMLSDANILVEVSKSLISTGTEMSTVRLSESSLLEKARKRPQEVARVLQSVKVRGVKKTIDLVRSRLDESVALGYSCAGRVLAVGAKVTGFQPGDRVACAGAKLANHAEVVSVPKNLAVRIPASVDDVSGAFVTVGSIALQGVRRADAKLGETVCVIGLGLIGQITVQLLRAAGCRVIGMDPDDSRVRSAMSAGMAGGGTAESDVKRALEQATRGLGADQTIITASTESSDPARSAFHFTRKKGRIVVVGAVGMDLDRSPFYEKEQDFLISCSYGPGRYDASYEESGIDYPVAYVRWTENRNMAAFIQLISDGKIDVRPFVGRIVPVGAAPSAYEALKAPGKKPLAVVLDYESEAAGGKRETRIETGRAPVPKAGRVSVGVIGLGNFVRSTHLPNLGHLPELFSIGAVCARRGASAESIAREVNAPTIATDPAEILRDRGVDAIVIGTRHDSHARLTADALNAGKHVFVEKPLALNRAELESVAEAVQKSAAVMMVGFNRRYSPYVAPLLDGLRTRIGPLTALYRVNAGPIPAGHWTKTDEGGGRLRGEACHMIDLFRRLVGRPVVDAAISSVRADSEQHRSDENFAATLRYEDGSVCTLLYTSVGSPSTGKERLEAFWDGSTAIIDDFRSIRIFGPNPVKRSGAPDKGHLAALRAFGDAIREGVRFPIPWDELEETTRVCIELDGAIWGRLTA